MRKVAYLDRDGVINVDTGYVIDWAKFEFCEGIFEFLVGLLERGFELIIVTNQSGIARGYFKKCQVLKLHKALEIYCADKGVHFLDIIYCPHHPEGVISKYSIDCDCRKPKTGMIKSSAKKYGINLKQSIIIGDKVSDIKAGQTANLKSTFLVEMNKPNFAAILREIDAWL